MTAFNEMGLSEETLRAIIELNYELPTPVQEKVIPHLLQENFQDVIALAQTGTGKTAAFGLPIIEKTDMSKRYTQHLILCPTRELCLQVADDITSYAKYHKNLRIAAVFGGTSIDRQIRVLKDGAQIVSATPGRLLDLIRRKEVNLSKIKTLILDEADEMLNMGFREDIETILKETPSEKNTLMFSATMPNEILEIANKYLKDHIQVTIGKKNAGADGVVHECYMVQAKDRYLALKRIVDFYPDVYGIVFCRTRIETQEVADNLMKDGYNADALHGDLSQAQRDAVMNKFRTRHLRMLVATDVAARGLDVDDLTHVINYNLPEELEIYTHRSGRTGRAGKKGISIIIANLKEKYKIKLIENQIKKQFEIKPIPNGKDVCQKQLFHLIDRIEKVDVKDEDIDAFLPDIYRKLEWLDREELIKKFVSVEFNRFLEYYKNSKDINVYDDGYSKKANFVRMFINLGRKDQITPPDLIGVINDITDTKHISIGKIKILQYFSFFEIDKQYVTLVLDNFKNTTYHDRKITIEITEEEDQDKRGGDRRGFRRDDRRDDRRSDSRDDRGRRDYKDRGTSSGRSDSRYEKRSDSRSDSSRPSYQSDNRRKRTPRTD